VSKYVVFIETLQCLFLQNGKARLPILKEKALEKASKIGIKKRPYKGKEKGYPISNKMVKKAACNLTYRPYFGEDSEVNRK